MAPRCAWWIPIALGLLAPAARAQEPSADRLRTAAREYDEGRRLFLENQYQEAAVHFENAFVDAPRAEALRNAIRARRAAKQYARAATLAQLALLQYDGDAQTTALANETLAEASPRVFAVTLACDPKCAVAADQRALSLVDARVQRVFLDPGPHDVVVSFGDRVRQMRIEAKAGEKTELSVQPPGESAPPPRPAAAEAPSAREKPFGPVVFVTFAALTAVAGGATIVSGLDARSNPGADAVRRDCVGQGESCPTYQRGRDAQLRTNVALAATGGLAVVTAIVGVFFTQWSAASPPPHKVGVSIAPSPWGLSGTF